MLLRYKNGDFLLEYFIKIFLKEWKAQCIYHRLEILQGLKNIHDVIIIYQDVKVRVIVIKDGKISLSMRDVDEKTGRDYLETAKNVEDKNNLKSNPIKPVVINKPKYGDLTGIPLEEVDYTTKKRLNSPELWELNQMKNGKILPLEDILNQNQDAEEEVEIELREEEPPFLKGQTAKAGVHFSPIRLVKNPNGNLHRAAI